MLRGGPTPDGGLPSNGSPTPGGESAYGATIRVTGDVGSRRSLWPVLAVLAVIGLTIGIIGYVYFSQQQNKLRAATWNDLGSIGRLKADWGRELVEAAQPQR